jgi:dolichol-phosphate mannosyltransferase
MAKKVRLSKDIVLSVVAPVYNEEAGIDAFVKATHRTLKGMGVNYELVLVNDGSRDDSLAVMNKLAEKNRNIRVLDLSRNYGREIAMTAGLEHAVGDYVVLMDSDMQDPPELIPDLMEKLIDGQYDVVYAARTSRAGETFMKRFTSRLFYRTARRMTGLDIPDDAGDFRVFSRRVVNAVTAIKEHNRYLKMLYAYVGFRVGSVPFDRQERLTGQTSYNWIKLVDAALDAVFAFSNKPLRAISLLSVGLSFLLFLYALFIFLQKVMGANVVEGWTSLMLLVSFMFSILFIFLAILSEYIGRILTESKNRPLYYIREEHGGTSFDVPSMIQKDEE